QRRRCVARRGEARRGKEKANGSLLFGSNGPALLEVRIGAPPARRSGSARARLDGSRRAPSLRESHDALSLGAERLGDPSLGLEMGLSLCFGSGGVFDYAVRSAPTVRDSLTVAARFSALIATPLLVSLESRGRQSIIRLEDEIPWLKVLGDFALSAWYRTHAADELPRGAHPEVWIPYAAPQNTAAHERAFPGATLKFGAPFLGFVFDRHYEEAPMPVAIRSFTRCSVPEPMRSCCGSRVRSR
ncbi:MAG TPA: AraC family transcriptional regulator ligand-binding domain-containing protein, partial [Polyangiaceae bacterium]